jgi:hypothetical protein
MWLLAVSIFASLKWLTWWSARSRILHSAWRSIGYLLAWPGMDAQAFLDTTQPVPCPDARAWITAALKTTLGIAWFWLLPRSLPLNEPLFRGWAGMIGLVMVLHFGTFEIISLVWQTLGIKATPIMSAPLRSSSLGEFWGKRWNLGFRQLAHELIFRPLYRRLGANIAGFLVFAVSGLIHDLVISFPARGGFGLPTLYFLIQGAGVALERSTLGKRLGLGHQSIGWLFMAIVLVAPVYWLFHPQFVLRVILPFMQAIRAV